jgi:hypothetical protein
VQKIAGVSGRLITKVILRPGGEAQTAVEAFANLPEDDQHDLPDLLNSLVFFPPGAITSNLTILFPSVVRRRQHAGNRALHPEGPRDSFPTACTRTGSIPSARVGLTRARRVESAEPSVREQERSVLASCLG